MESLVPRRNTIGAGKVDAALAELEQETNEGARTACLPIVLHAAGRQAEADAALKAAD